MPLSNQKKEALRKEWKKVTKKLIYPPSPKIDSPIIYDYWLTVIDSLIDEKVKEIEKKAQSQDCSYAYGEGTREGLYVAIKILKE